jgi:putative transposase
MAEAFVCTMERDYVRISLVLDAESVLRQHPGWLSHYNEVHPLKALAYRSPREFIATRSTPWPLSGHSGATTRGVRTTVTQQTTNATPSIDVG